MARSEGYLGSKIDQKTHPRNQNQVHRAATSFLVGETVGFCADARSCTCTLRINTPGSPTDRHKNKKIYTRGLSWPPSGPRTLVDALAVGRADARHLRRPPHLATSHDPACSHPHWLRPRRHAKEQDLAQRPDVLGQARGHRWRARPPLLGRAAALGRLGQRQGLAPGGMRQAEIVVHVIQRQLLVYAVLAFAERRHTPPDRGDLLADTEVEAFNARRVDLPAAGRQYLLGRRQGAEHHAVAHPYQTPAPPGLDHLRIEELGPWHPTRLR